MEKKQSTILLVGAGLTNAVIARQLAEQGYQLTVIDKRGHVAGNCHTERDGETGVMVHQYGPHIFHTDNEQVWDYVNRFATLMPFVNRVKTVSQGAVYTLPINLHTINQFFGTTYSPNAAKAFIDSQADLSITAPKTFEEQAMRFVGKDLYRAFFYGYTKKQWGVEPRQLPASILQRLPVRFTYNDNYFSHQFQGIPKEGYSELVDNMLSHDNITVLLNTPFSADMKDQFAHIFWSGPLDAWFNYNLGRLGYRTLDFEVFREDGDFQGNAVINYADENVPYTRISEHKHFAPWENHDKSICYREFSRACEDDDTPYYPIRLVNDKALLKRYVDKANREEKVTFVGRLGTYRYLDMDVSIAEALQAAENFIAADAQKSTIPAFFVEVI